MESPEEHPSTGHSLAKKHKKSPKPHRAWPENMSSPPSQHILPRLLHPTGLDRVNASSRRHGANGAGSAAARGHIQHVLRTRVQCTHMHLASEQPPPL